MRKQTITLAPSEPLVVGSYGSLNALHQGHSTLVTGGFDLIEIRLDILKSGGWDPAEKPWSAVSCMPLLFTARCRAEGGALDLSASQRHELLMNVIDEAALIDIELASFNEMHESIDALKEYQIPWVASYHRFDHMPDLDTLREKRDLAHASGAAVFKCAAMMHTPEDIETMLIFQQEPTPILLSTMGMGQLAPESRVRCALAGSVLNYGFLGSAPTAPGQWDAPTLHAAIHAGHIPARSSVVK
jgi:3-dehydroquinate dehydratase type I